MKELPPSSPGNLFRSTYQVRRAMALTIVLAVLNSSAIIAFASPTISPKAATGVITVDGVVTINGSRAMLRQTLFSGSKIATAAKSESILMLDNRARVKLDTETSLTLEYARSNLSGLLEQGSMQAFTPAGVSAQVTTADAAVTTDPAQPAAFHIKVESCTTTIEVQTGRVEVRAGSKVSSLVAGESLSTAETLPTPQQNFNKKKAGIFIAIGAAIAVVLIAVTRESADKDNPGCVVILSGSSGGTCVGG